MAAFITLFDWTDQGVRNAKETVNRARAFRQALEAASGRLIGIWWTLGQHDGVFIFEAADDAAATQALVAVGMVGNIRTQTMRAFSEDEMERIVGGLP
jgi:uncharacterized protein with GYD domain